MAAFGATPACADLTDEQVDHVQDRFQFRNPDGSGIPHDDLKAVLLQRNGEYTFLEQGLRLGSLNDTKAKFGVNQFYSAPSELNAELILDALGYPDYLGVAEGVLAWKGLMRAKFYSLSTLYKL